MNRYLLIGLIIFIIIIVILFFCLIYLHNKRWPLYFNLINKGELDTQVKVLFNGSELITGPVSLPVEQNIKTIVNAKNKRTNNLITRDQSKNISIYVATDDCNIIMESGNLPNYKIVRSSDSSGIYVLDNNPGNVWLRSGWYVISFTNGIPIF